MKNLFKKIAMFVSLLLTFSLMQTVTAHAAPKTVCFNGSSSSYLDRPSGMTNLPTNVPYTMEAWVRLDDQRLKAGLVGWGAGSSNATNSFAFTNGYVYNWWYGNDIKADSSAFHRLGIGSWSHVAVQWDGTTRTVYKDGILVKTNAGSGLNASNTSSFRVSGYSGEHFYGCMSSLRIVRNQIVYTGNFSVPSALEATQSADGNINAIASGNTVLLLTNPTDYLKDESGTGNDLTAHTVSTTTDAPVTKTSQTITFGSLPSTTINTASITIGSTSGYAAATSNRGLAITYSASAGSSSYCSVSSVGVITIKAIGTCVVQADNSGNSTYAAATQQTQNLVIAAAVPDAPTITSVSAGDTSTVLSWKPNRNGGAAITTETITVNDVTAATTSYITLTSGSSYVSGTFPGDSVTALTYKIRSLTNGHAYTFAVTVRNSAGASLPSATSEEVTPVGAPNAVTDLRASAGDQNVVLNWTKPSAFGGGSFTNYTVFQKLHSAASFPAMPVETITSVNTQTSTITGLTNGTAYDFKVLVTASGGSGAASDYSAFTNLIPASVPDAPIIGITYVTDTSAAVVWRGRSGNGSPITGYNISVTKNGASTSCTGGDTSLAAGSSCDITGAPGDAFIARASVRNLIGASDTTTSSTYSMIGTVDTPTAVTGAAGDGTATLTFTQNTNGDILDYYEYSIDSGTTFISLSGNSSPLVISGLTNGTDYTIVIRGVGRDNGPGPISAPVVVKPAVPTPAPSSGGGSAPTRERVPVVVKEEEKPKVVVITKETLSKDSPVVAVGVDAIKDPQKFDSFFKTPTTGTTPTTPVVTPITATNIVVVSANTSVNTQGVKTTSDKPVTVPINLTAPIITDEAAKALSAKVVVESSASNLKITAVNGFTGVVIVPVVATVNGVQTTVLNRVVVSPVLPIATGFAPVDIGKSSIAWQASASQVVSYEVAVNGKVACTTPTTSCPLPALIGPNTKVTVNAIGNDETKSGPQVIPYAAVKPIPALKLNFNSGSAVLTAAQKKEIDKVANVIDTQGFTRLVVNGFTDSTGSPALNAALSKARANAVVAYMKILLPEVAVKAGANGAAQPLADNKSLEGRAQNRRTEIATW